MKANIDPRESNRIAANKQRQLLIAANKITNGKHNGSKPKSTLVYLEHRLNNQVRAFYEHNR